MIAFQLPQASELVNKCQAVLWALAHSDCYSAIQQYNWTRIDPAEDFIEGGNLLSASLLRTRRLGMKCRYRCLQLIRSNSAHPKRPRHAQAFIDLCTIPK